MSAHSRTEKVQQPQIDYNSTDANTLAVNLSYSHALEESNVCADIADRLNQPQSADAEVLSSERSRLVRFPASTTAFLSE